MAPESALQALERRLLDAATDLSGATHITELVERLRPALALDPEPLAAGLALLDEERGLWVYHAQHVGRAGLEGLEASELPVAEGEARRFEGGRREPIVESLAPTSGNAFERALAARGARTLASAPLYFGERLFGTVFLGDASAPAAERLAYLARLARIVEPHAWNCVTERRLSRGDRRRDALRELGRVINTSLDPRTVLQLARRAIGSLEGHRASFIGLLDDGGVTWRRYDRPAEPLDGESEPERRAVAGSVQAHLLSSGRTYESGDLALGTVFREDAELLGQGVRRYVATPLGTGGKALGLFLFGTDNPHPFLRVDVYVFENIAVQLALAIDNALHYEEIQRLSVRREQQNAYLREEIRTEQQGPGMLGTSSAMQRVRDRIARVAGTESTVLINGPTGVGKELVARAIHEASRRRDQPLVKLNCAAIPEGMVESELFGHERGAFTSAVDRRIGRFELAHNGTLFLDEIGELSLALQAKLLRVLQSGEFERVGGSRTLASNARIIAATNRDLSKALASGAFRSDLYYRLNVFPIEVPTLEERREDVPLLAQAFLEHFARRTGKRLEGIEPDSLERLCRCSWPGNVRELKHVIERAVILCDGPLLVVEDDAAPVRSADAVARPAEREIATLEEAEEALIRSALLRTNGVVEGPNGAAALLGLKGSTLRFRMKRRGIQRPEG